MNRPPVTLTIDGRLLEVQSQTTILEAARALGIDIPTLCYHKALVPHAGCRLCLVQVAGRRELQASCTHPVESGMVVLTDSPRVQRARRLVIEMLYLRCPEVPRIKQLAAEFGVDTRQLEQRFTVDNEECILCDLCVRICKERLQVNAFDYINRGHLRKLSTPYNQPSPYCLACGACQSVCPLGTVDLADITNHPPRPIRSEHEAGMSQRGPIFLPFPQSVPRLPVIDRDTCAYFQRGVCQTCTAICEAGAIDHNQRDTQRQIEVGAVVLAPGVDVVDPTVQQEYGYGRWPDVITGIQFERILSASGPSAGVVRRPSGSGVPRRIAFIQCVGSRQKHRVYCSSVCCMYTTKQALAVKEALPGVETVVFYQDLRGIGKGYEAFLQSARESGVIYIHGLPSSVRKAPGGHDLMVQFTSDDGRPALQEFDMVVLATGLEPGASGSALARLFGVKQNRFGFVETDPLLPTDTSINGIYTAGTITGPKDISESVAQGSAAAVRAMVLLSGQPRALVIKDLPSPERIVETREPQVGVFVCHCGRNIAGAVSIDEVVRQTGHLPEVAFIEDYQYVCSAEGQERIQRKIADLGLNRVVIAACSPAIHEGHFRDTLRKAGLNPYFLEIANIRDQCAWVHPQNRAAATSKATDLVRMAVARSRKAEPVSAIRLAVVPRALVIGGGLAGLTAAFEMASLGLEVAILEREDHLGGNMMRLQYLLNHEDPQVYVDNLIERVTIHPLIHVYTSAALEKISGSVGRFLSSVRQNGRVIEIEHGVVVVATGGIEHRPTGHLLGSHPGVLTQLDLESRLAAGDFKVETIVMLQCVGSRRPGRPYCSRVCCTQAVKNALRLKELHPSLPIVIAHRDIRTYGMDEEAYLQARRKGIRFIRLVDESKPIIEPNLHSGGLSITVHDSSLRGWLRLETSHLVLSTGIEPNPGNRDLSQMLGVPLNSDAFFLEAHAKLRPVETQTEGIFLCGLAHSPQTVGETIVQARAAVARAATILCQPYLEKENIVAEVADELCDGCGYCIEPCPYQAITLSEQTRDGLVKKIVTVDQTKCLGCGICQAVCPKRGINVRNFRPDQLMAMVDAALATRVSGPTS